MKYTRTVTYLLPSPYQTNCFDYSKLDCQSRSECIRKCQFESALKLCDSLPLQTLISKEDIQNDNNKYQYKYKYSNCINKFNLSICESKFKSPDCVNEYYSFKPIIPIKLNRSFDNLTFSRFNGTIRGMKNDYRLFSNIQINFGGEPDTIHRHSPAQYPVEFVTFLCGVISLWTGFSIISMYGYGKRFFMGHKITSNQKIILLINRMIKLLSINKIVGKFKRKRKCRRIFVRTKYFSKTFREKNISI